MPGVRARPRAFLSRKNARLPFVAAFALGGAAICGVCLRFAFVPDNRALGVFIANALFIATGVFLVGYGVHALQKPTSLVLVDSAGTDAWGQARYGRSHQATSEQGTTIGAICLVLGLLLAVSGVFVGAIARAIGIPTS